jgi:hypothetical protein
VRIRQDAHNRFSLNDLHRASGRARRQGPSFWLDNKQTQELVDEVAKEMTDTGNPVSVIKGGPGQGTYVARDLVYAYAMWISAKFHLKVIRAFDALVSGAMWPRKSTTSEHLDILQRDFEKMGNSLALAQVAGDEETRKRLAGLHGRGLANAKHAKRELEVRQHALSRYVNPQLWDDA